MDDQQEQQQQPAEAPPLAVPGITFADIVRDTGLDRSQVRALLGHLEVRWTFDGHSNRVDRDDYKEVREALRAVPRKLEARDLELSKAAPVRRKPRRR